MDCCLDKNIIKNKSEYICMNCGVIHEYEYVHFNYNDDYNLILNNMIKYKKSCYKRRKYLINKCKKLDINIIYLLDESLEKIRISKNMKRISISKYLNNLYRYYYKKANIEYQDLINTKNNFSINEENFNEIYEKYKYVEKMKMVYFIFKIFY